MRNAKCFKLTRKWRVSLKRTRVAEDGGAPSHRCRNAAFQTHAACSHDEPGAAKKYTCIRGDKSSGSFSLGRGRSIAFELVDNARVFSELSHDVVRLIDEVEHTTSKLFPSRAANFQEAHHFSLLANQVLKNAQRGSATCKQIDNVIADSVERIRQGLMVMEQAGVQMLQIIDSVIQASEVTAFMGKPHPAASQHLASPEPYEEDDDSDLLLQESALAVQDLKCWALVLKRNLQTLRLSELDEHDVAIRQVSDGTMG
ncbi:hypothetical protein [Dyella nitratireducens]|uniref:hypothetical protein n=1 Tax=Dyella nitratireducens TaxID=1849580 RepID=UPI001667FA11|nr:hypothetical protein [Dyella nitratireducens]